MTKRLKVRSSTSSNGGVHCPICDKRYSLTLLLQYHLPDHQIGRFGVKKVEPLEIEVFVVVPEGED